MTQKRTSMDSLTELVATIREDTDREIKKLNAAIEQTTQNVDRAVAGMQQSASRIEHQVGIMSEHLTAIDIKIERLADRIDQLITAVDGHLRVAEKQADNIGELTKLVAAQANSVAMLISRTG